MTESDTVAPDRTQAPTIGLLYPGHSAEDDYPALEERLGGAVRLPLVHTSVDLDAHEVGALLDLGNPKRLADGARELPPGVDVVLWACTSGSFVFGWDGARKQVDELAAILGTPASSTSIAFVEALRTLGLSRVSIAASYPEPVAQSFVDFLGRGGMTVTAMGFHDIFTAAEVGTLDEAGVLELGRVAKVDGAEALIIPDTAMHTLSYLEALEEAVGIPVLTANQVTVHEGLRLLGPVPRLPGLGTLFR
jgi:maleate cis-trans isomerase